MEETQTADALAARAREMRRMAAKSPFKKDRERFAALAADFERRTTLARAL